METLYLVAKGEYSSYYIECAARTEAEADAIATKIGGGAFTEEVHVVAPDEVYVARCLHLEATTDGAGALVGEWSLRERFTAGDVSYGAEPDLYAEVDSTSLRVWGYGTDHERLRKAFSERLARKRQEQIEALPKRSLPLGVSDDEIAKRNLL